MEQEIKERIRRYLKESKNKNTALQNPCNVPKAILRGKSIVIQAYLTKQEKNNLTYHLKSVQSLSHVWLFVTPWITACQAFLSITNSWSLLKPIHRVGDAIQPSHSLSSPSPPVPNPSHHQGLFQRVNSSHDVAKALEFQLQLQHQSFQWTPRTDLL